jgi:hypothetical protein
MNGLFYINVNLYFKSRIKKFLMKQDLFKLSIACVVSFYMIKRILRKV